MHGKKKQHNCVPGFGFLGIIWDDSVVETSNFISLKIWWLVISASLGLTCEMIENANDRCRIWHLSLLLSCHLSNCEHICVTC